MIRKTCRILLLTLFFAELCHGASSTPPARPEDEQDNAILEVLTILTPNGGKMEHPIFAANKDIFTGQTFKERSEYAKQKVGFWPVFILSHESPETDTYTSTAFDGISFLRRYAFSAKELADKHSIVQAFANTEKRKAISDSAAKNYITENHITEGMTSAPFACIWSYIAHPPYLHGSTSRSALYNPDGQLVAEVRNQDTTSLGLRFLIADDEIALKEYALLYISCIPTEKNAEIRNKLFFNARHFLDKYMERCPEDSTFQRAMLAYLDNPPAIEYRKTS